MLIKLVIASYKVGWLNWCSFSLALVIAALAGCLIALSALWWKNQSGGGCDAAAVEHEDESDSSVRVSFVN